MKLLSWEHRDIRSEVLIVTNMWPEPGRPVYGIFVQRQVESIRRLGVPCDVLYVRGFQSPLAYPYAAAWFAASNHWMSGHYRLIHAHAGETGVVARFHVRTPLLVSYCGDDVLGKPAAAGGIALESRMRSWVIRETARLDSQAITKSDEMRNRLPSTVTSRTTVLPNGINCELFAPMPQADARKGIGWPVGVPTVLFAGTAPWSPRKRHWLAQEACAVAEEQLGVQVRLEVAENVPPDKIPLLMNAADCLMMTSSIEGSPNVVKEAMMCNLPVVSTDVGDVKALLEPVDPSWICDANGVALGAALADCVRQGRRSNGRLQRRWLSDDAIARDLLRVYDATARHTFPGGSQAIRTAG